LIVGSMEPPSLIVNTFIMFWTFQVIPLKGRNLFSWRKISSSPIHFTRRCSFTWQKEQMLYHWKSLLSCNRNHCSTLRVSLSTVFHLDQLTSRQCHCMAHHWFGLHEVTWNYMEQ